MIRTHRRHRVHRTALLAVAVGCAFSGAPAPAATPPELVSYQGVFGLLAIATGTIYLVLRFVL